jgi:drug/metabolite transporter (DMT)-like permease
MGGVSLGQVFFRSGATRMVVGDSWTAWLLNPYLIGGVTVYVLATLLWIYVLRSAPLSRVYPIFALSFLLVPLLEYLTMSEPLRLQSFVGGAVIIAGVLIAVHD